MAVLTRIWEGRGLTINDRAEVEIVEPYRFVSDVVYQDPYAVLTAALLLGLPQRFDPHPTYAGAKVVKLGPRQTDEPKVWLIEATYSTVMAVEDRYSEPNPLLRPPEYSFSFSRHQKVLTKDLIGAAVVTSALQAFDPPLEVDDSRPVLKVTRYESTFSAAIAVQYQDAVNSDTFAGSPARTWKVMDISARETQENGQVVQHVTYEFEGRREGWGLKVLDQGTMRLNASTRRPEDIIETRGPGAGKPVTAPVPLNGDGRPLSDAYTNLTGDIDAVSGDFDVDDTTFFCPIATATAQGGEVVIKIDDEVMRVTEISGDTVNVIRGYQGTTAAAHTATAVVQQQPFFIEFIIHNELPFSALNLGL